MLRLVGILIGSAVAVATLIIAVGVPRLTPTDEPVAEISAEPEPASVDVAEPQEEQTAPTQATQAAEEPAEEMLSDAETAALIEEIFAPQPEPAPADAVTTNDPDREDNWYAFWSPFRSEIAANGFVSRLQETTGIDYRVVKVKTGVYEVAFAYVDDTDIQDKLERISAATGLNVTGS